MSVDPYGPDWRSPARPECPECHGTGQLAGFGPCDCDHHLATAGAVRSFERTERGERYGTYATPERHGDGTGRGHRPAMPADLADLGAWLAAQTWSTFAASLAQQWADTGRLSPRQIDAARSMRTKCEARDAERRSQAETRGDQLGTVDLAAVPAGRYAIDTRRYRIEHGTGRWEGWTFVRDGSEYGADERYGTQRPAETYRGKRVDDLAAIVADPYTAAARYGQITGTCGVCGRTLEDPESVARGIGPVCLAKF